MKQTLTIVLAAIALAGCATQQGAIESLTPVCEALGAPISYNSTNQASEWHAGKKLAPVLAKRNRVGVNLHCKAYK